MADAKQEGGRASGKRLAGFDLISKIGRGGMGVVYKARQISMNRLVALKILSPRLSQNKNFIKRFMREAQAVARLNHRHIVQGIDAGEADGFYYFAMEYVDGETVHQMIMRESTIDERIALEIARDTARALSHAHKVGLVHRDIKPGNIMLTKGGVTKLCDLGLAREQDVQTAPAGKRHVAVGTPYYISPEQAMGQDNADIRSDIYSLGATLYRMIVGEPPFDGDSPGEILSKHIQDPLPWPSAMNDAVTDRTSHLIARMMAKDPAERYQTPAELQQDVERILADEPPAAMDVSFKVPPVKQPGADRKSADRFSRRKEALRETYEIRQMAREAAEEQEVPLAELTDSLKGNLDEEDPVTFIKYALLVLTEGNFEGARENFQRARELGMDVGAFVERLNILATPREMVYIPKGRDSLGPPQKAREIKCGAFYIDIYPVTNQDYAEFAAVNSYSPPAHWPDGKPPEGKDDHPVVCVSWDDARAYALWAGRQLPNSTQWERAARNGDQRLYPWGNDFSPDKCNTQESGVGDTTPVGRYEAGQGPYGTADMAGNVWEWLRDEPSNKETSDSRIAAGGCWRDAKDAAMCYHRRKMKRNHTDLKTGFRCVMSL